MKPKTVLLVNPPFDNFEDEPYPPLGLAYIASVLEKNGFDVKILDMPIFKITIDETLVYFEKINPDVVGIGCAAANYTSALKIAKLAKEVINCLVIMGGPHVTYIGKEVLKENKYVDIVVRNEGELTVLEIMSALKSRKGFKDVKGIDYRNSEGLIFSNPERPLFRELDKLPFPGRHLIPMDKYRELNQYTSIIGSRGCIYNCIYCSSSEFWRHKVRFRNPVRIVDELESVHRIYGFSYFRFLDDVFLTPRKSKKLLNELKQRELGIKWSCNARVDLVTQEILEMAAKTGCIKITFGVESVSEGVLHRINKKFSIDQIRSAVKLAKENGIDTKLNFIFVLPNQDEKDIFASLNLIKELMPSSVMFGILTPYIGTEIVKNSEKYGITITNKEWWKYGSEPSPIYNSKLGYKNMNSIVSRFRKKINNLRIPIENGY